MTKIDQEIFFKYLSVNFNNLSIIDYNPSKDKRIKNINLNNDHEIISAIAIINHDIISMEEYQSLITKNGDYYYFPSNGKGIIQYLYSEISEYHNSCLASSNFSSSFKEEDENTDRFVKKVFKELKSNSKYIYRRTSEGEYYNIPDKMFFAWPDAAQKYNGEGDQYLSLGYSIFAISK